MLLTQTAPLSTSLVGTHLLQHCSVAESASLGGDSSPMDSADSMKATPSNRLPQIPHPQGAIAYSERFSEAQQKNIDAWFACVECWCDRQCFHPTRRVEVAVSLLDVTHLAKARASRIVDTFNFIKFKTRFKSILGCNESKSALSARRRAPSAPLRRSIGAAGLETLFRNCERRSQIFLLLLNSIRRARRAPRGTRHRIGSIHPPLICNILRRSVRARTLREDMYAERVEKTIAEEAVYASAARALVAPELNNKREYRVNRSLDR